MVDEHYSLREMIQSGWGQNDYKIIVIGVDTRKIWFDEEIELSDQHDYSISVFQPPISSVYNVTVWRKHSQDYSIHIGTSTVVLTDIVPVTKVEFEDIE